MVSLKVPSSSTCLSNTIVGLISNFGPRLPGPDLCFIQRVFVFQCSLPWKENMHIIIDLLIACPDMDDV